MPFKRLDITQVPRRLWALVGFPGSGKSTFAMQMRGPVLAIDADQRVDEVARLAKEGVYQLSDTPADNVSVERIAAHLRANMPGSDIKTIIVDSLTAIMAPLVTQAILDNDAGANKNRMAAWKDKALAMRLLQDSVGMWGTDALYIYHLQAGRDDKAREVTTETISRTEQARLYRSINLKLTMIANGSRRGIRVDWARRGRAGAELWDDSGAWLKMPERIEAEVYGGLSQAEQDAIEAARPTSFAGPEQAIAWGLDQGCFDALQHARNAYDKLKAEHKPQSAHEMWALWIADVSARLAAMTTASAGAPQTF